MLNHTLNRLFDKYPKLFLVHGCKIVRRRFGPPLSSPHEDCHAEPSERPAHRRYPAALFQADISLLIQPDISPANNILKIVLLSLFIHAITAKSATQKSADRAAEGANCMQAAQTKYFDQQIALALKETPPAEQDRSLPLGAPAITHQPAGRVYFVHFVYFVHMWKNEKFTAYPHEKKAPVYFVHFSRKFFARGARMLPFCPEPNTGVSITGRIRTAIFGISQKAVGIALGYPKKILGFDLGLTWDRFGISRRKSFRFWDHAFYGC